jgi:hypothetical protein
MKKIVLILFVLLVAPKLLYAETAHILEIGKNNKAIVIYHVQNDVITSNSAGETWVDCVRSIGLNITVLEEGSLPGQITTQEKANIEAGLILEFKEAGVLVDPNTPLEGDIRYHYNQNVLPKVDEVKSKLDVYGDKFTW